MKRLACACAICATLVSLPAHARGPGLHAAAWEGGPFVARLAAVDAQDGDLHLVVAADDGSVEAAELDVAADAHDRTLGARARWVEPSGGAPLLVVDVFALGEPALMPMWVDGPPDYTLGELVSTAVFDVVDDRLEVVARTDARDVDAYTRLRIEDLNGDGLDEVTLVEDDPGLALCGVGARHGLRVFDPTQRAFRPASRPVSVDVDTEIAPGPVGVARDRDPRDARLVRATSNAADAVPHAPGPLGDVLVDGDESTGWIEAQAGSGAGAWLAGTVVPGVGLVSVVAAPLGGIEPPTSLLLLTDDGAVRLTGPLDGPTEWRLPRALDTRCVAVVVEGTGDATTTGLGELALRTRLDAPLDTLVDEAITVATLSDAPSTIAALGALDDDVLAAAAATALGSARTTLIRARLADDAERVVNEAVEDDDDALDTLAGALRGDASEPWVLAVLESYSHRGMRGAALDAVDRALTLSAEHVLAMTTEELAPRGADVARRLDAADLTRLLHAVDLDGDPLRAARLIAIGAGAARFADARSDAEIAALAANAIEHDNGSIARAGIALAEVFDMEVLWPALAAMAGSDPAPELRAQAVRAIGAWATRGVHVAGSGDVLVAGLEDPDATVRLASLDALPLAPSPRTVFALEAIARDDVWPDLRASALAYLASEAPDHAQAIAEEKLGGDDPAEALRVVEALEGTGVVLQASALLDCAGRWTDDPALVWAMAHAADARDASMAAAWASEHVDDASPRAVRVAAASLVPATDSARSAITAWLVGEDDVLAAASIAALLRWSDDDALDALRDALAGCDDEARCAALELASARLGER